jgi:hypothetical protein
MIRIHRTVRGIVITGAFSLGLAGCDLGVTNPGIIDASAFDPTSDAAALSLSAQQVFFSGFQSTIQAGGLLSEELWTGALRLEQNDISRRTLTPVNLDVNGTVFAPLSRAFVTNDDVAATLATAPGAGADLNVARAWMGAGFSLVLLAEQMCAGAIRESRLLTTNELLDSAIVRFQRAVTVATAANVAADAITDATAKAAAKAAADAMLNASNVGLARAQLQKGDNDAASATAALVPATASDYTVVTIDELSNRSLGNSIHSGTTGGTLSVPRRYQITDSRVRWVTATTAAQDPSLTPFVQQQKYIGFAAPIRVASYLEARYILAEAELKKSNPAPAVALIAERTSPTVAGAAATPLEATTVLGQLMELRAREFWLEGKKLGDIRRNPDVKAYYDAPDTPFYKSGNFGSAVCFPIPQEEINTNPNIP